ncbi:DUF2914 domain-containing protein [Ekhidna sp.]|uniref:DUF2914 domain-containing protein n=1 Tax=Ekhidna sp. TaxID=2608089 RepID=UPI003BAAA55F
MIKILARYKKSAFSRFIQKHEKYAPIFFFMGGFIFDSLTLGRIDRLYDLTILCLHMTSLSVTLYIYNRIPDGKWKGTLIDRYKEYLPLAIQFFFGALSSAYVVYFSRSVSLSKTAYFFGILVLLLFANEFLKKRISNKYLQFSIYFFLSFTFFTFIIPVFIKAMNTNVFIFSGAISLLCTLTLILIVYRVSPNMKVEVKLWKLLGIVLVIYVFINSFYFFRLIPPVPLALSEAIVAHNIQRDGNKYVVSFERDEWYVFWRTHRREFIWNPDEKVYVFSSIFAPTDLKKTIFHRWKWYNARKEKWEFIEDITYEIMGGRDGGYRGYTYKSHVKEGEWKVEVLTEEELVLGVIEFEIQKNENKEPHRLINRKF